MRFRFRAIVCRRRASIVVSGRTNAVLRIIGGLTYYKIRNNKLMLGNEDFNLLDNNSYKSICSVST